MRHVTIVYERLSHLYRDFARLRQRVKRIIHERCEDDDSEEDSEEDESEDDRQDDESGEYKRKLQLS